MKAGLGAFAIGAAIILVFARGDAAMQRVGAILMFAGGVVTLVAALAHRWQERREIQRRPPRR